MTENHNGQTGFEPYDARPWLAHYEEGRQPDLGELPFSSFGEMVRKASREHGSKPAFTTCL
ncbi:MAG: hypothetical protein JJT90_12175, partial [Ectothiorhodospiraceae bacterium]|nr:hypothetical protein [Ectothiorhodospiraceae bacterium]